jgi:hypothetical protein
LCTQLKNLNEIIILDSPNLTDDAFEYLSYAIHLKKLKIANNKNLTDFSIKSITKSCIELRYISLTDCERISDSSLKCMSNLRNLCVLNLADCFR